MGLARKTLLWISENRKLRQSLPNLGFIQRAVKRFMPGEKLSDALWAAEELRADSVNTIITHLGENISQEREAAQVRDHYIDALQQINNHSLDAYLSVKLTQLGLDLSEDFCAKSTTAIVEAAHKHRNMVWIDMEQSHYVDRTLNIYKRIKQKHSNVGICLQAYLYRTEKDIRGLIPLEPAIRLVKGAYSEPGSIAFPKKTHVDANYQKILRHLLQNIKKHNLRLGVATHDQKLIRYAMEEASRENLGQGDYEFQLLYGIRTDQQKRLATEGFKVRALISYGTYWFPWYVRRLAERPANVFFVLKNLTKR